MEPEALPGGEIAALGAEVVAPGAEVVPGADEAGSADLGALVDDTQEPSPDGEGAEQSEAEEVVSPDEAKEAATFSVTADPVPPSPEGEGNADAGNESLTVTWCFIVDWTLYAQQEAKEGEEIVCPEAPEAPEGMAFAGWFLEDGTQLFIDADGDGMIDPVVAHVDPLCPEVNVYARFEAQEPSPEGEGIENAENAENAEQNGGVDAATEAGEVDEADENMGGGRLPPSRRCRDTSL